jgi:FkbM family methyltransferase
VFWRRSPAKPKVQFATIGRYRIQLPPGSRLLVYQDLYKRYDVALGEIARIARAKYPGLHAIDIGANVGDTAALIRKHADIPVLCIEGDPAVVPILRQNAGLFGNEVEIEQSFIGPEGQFVDEKRIVDAGRNASLRVAIQENGRLPFRSLKAILESHPRFSSAKLMKVDTEGFDFRIVRASLEWLGAAKPLVFLEYDPSFTPAEPDAGIDTLMALVGIGYEHFVFYDNFGNFIVSLRGAERDHFQELDGYLRANRKAGTIVHYFDVCAIHGEDADVAQAIRSHEMENASGRAQA